MSRTNYQYFATLQDATYLDELKKRLNQYRNFYALGLADRWRISLQNYYGTSPDGKTSWQVTIGGENGELVQQKVNEYASNVKHQLTLAVKDRPAGIAKAVNWDVKTLRDARLGSQLVEYYFTDPAHQFESDYIRALRIALLCAEAYIVQDWDTSRGEELAMDEQNGQMIRQGDLTQWMYGPWNAARDIWAPSEKCPWRIFSRFSNKYELAAQFPAYAEEIVRNAGGNDVAQPFYGNPSEWDSDYVEEHLFVHLPTLALGKGRYTRWVGDTKFMDVSYPYKARNWHRVVDEDLLETSHGHTSNYDLLGLEQVTDALHSIVLNNQSTYGVATLKAKRGNIPTVQELAKGMRVVELDKLDDLDVLDLVRTAPEIFKYEEIISNKKGKMSGINSVIAGDPQGALKGASGSALALLQSQALIFNSGTQKAFYQLLSSAGTGIIEMCRQFADEPRIVRIAGKANRAAVKEFKYDSNTLEAVSTVVFEPVNPVLQTAAGKVSVADSLLEKGMISSPKRYLEVYTTGNLDALIGDDVTAQDAILEENEYLSEGRPVEVVATENHEDHIKGHGATIQTPNAKEDPELVLATLTHNQDHINMWMWLSANNPALLIATGQKVLPVVPGVAGQPMPVPGQPGYMGAPPPGMPVPGEESAPSPDMEAPVPQDNLPNLPKPPANPATGEDAMVAPGTSVRQAA